MKRRDFIKKTGLSAVASGIIPTVAQAASPTNMAKPGLLRARRLQMGSAIGLIAPGSAPSVEKLSRAITGLTEMGYRVIQGPNLRAQNGYLAGTDAERLDDLHWAFSDPEVEAVWCVRGGYGCGRLLPEVDYKLIRKNPKPFIGYSDITALHVAISQKTGLVTFHGPVAASDFPESTLSHFKRVLVDPTARYEIAVPAPDAKVPGPQYTPLVLTSGTALGRLTGGNLSLLASLAGTAFAPRFKGRLVFMEEIGEQPYRIDRMLTQLLHGTDLGKAAGIVLGVFEDCQPSGKEPSLELLETLQDRLGGLGIPVAYGFPIGHISEMATLPYGVHAAMDTERGVLVLEEWGVV